MGNCARQIGETLTAPAFFPAVEATLGLAILLFKQRIGQLEALMFMGARIEEHQPARTKTFDLTDVMLAKPAPLIQSASVCKDVSPTCSVDMEVNCLLAAIAAPLISVTKSRRFIRSPRRQ
jgi:hypothetical protein